MLVDGFNMEDHRECCQWRPPEERCGAETKTAVCTRPKNHAAGQHYDAERSITFSEWAAGGLDLREVQEGGALMWFGDWYLGWSRNIAIGAMWTDTGKIAFLFLGLSLARGLPVKPPKSAKLNPCPNLVPIPNSTHADWCIDVKGHEGKCQPAHWDQDKDFCWCDK